jgi:hypothetical protein
MPATITVPYKILAKGFSIKGDVRSGLHATVPYLIAYGDFITFVNEALASPSATHIGGIIWNAPLQFPEGFGGRTTALYCQAFDVQPAGPNGQPIVDDPNNPGLAPGDFYQYAIVTLSFDTIPFIQGVEDDPGGLNQLDPENPITGCEQSVDIIGKMVTQQGSGYTYDFGSFAGKPVPGDIPLIQNEVKLVLRFPRVPYLPWQTVQPFVSKINSVPILNCAKGSLLLEGMGTVIAPTPNGGLGQNAVLKYAFNPDPTGQSEQGMDWNSFPLPDGSGYSTITSKVGEMTPYSYADFSAIFTELEF